MTRRRRAALATLVVTALLLAGCSAEGQPGPGEETPATGADPTSAPADPDQPDTQRKSSRVIVTHLTVPPLDLDRATARDLRRGRITDWAQLDRAPGPLRVVRRTAAVERDPRAVGIVPIEAVRPTVTPARVEGVDPVAAADGAVTLTVVGDLMLTRGVPDAGAALAPMSRRLRSGDLTVGNLESTLSTAGAPTQGGDSFGGSPALLGPLRRAGFDALSLANNHAGDYGTGALLDTVRTLAGSPMVPFGAGPDLAAAGRPAVLERGGVRFAFVAFNTIGETPMATPGSPGALSVRMPPRTGPLVPGDLDHVARLVRRADRSADVVVVMPHWGTQYTHRPEPIQRQVAERLAAAGADLVVGGHPHWVQGVDLVDGVPVLHSLGNYVFDMDFMQQTMEGVVLESTWWGAELKALRLVPYVMDPRTFAPRPATGAQAADILADVRSASTGPYQ